MECLDNLRVNVRRLRLLQGFTQQAVADRAGIEYKYFQNIEAGRWPNLTLSTVQKIAEAGPMGSVRELLVPAHHPWSRGVHVCADGTRLAHAQFLGEPAVRRGDRIAELARQRSLPRRALRGRSQFHW